MTAAVEGARRISPKAVIGDVTDVAVLQRVAQRLIDRGVTPSRAAAWAITVRIRLYASTCAHTSLRTMSGDWPRKMSICNVVFSDRRLSSFDQP